MSTTETHEVDAAITGAVISTAVVEGARVWQGDTLLTIGTLKLEIPVFAPVTGIVTRLLPKVGQRVVQGERLVSLSPSPAAETVEPAPGRPSDADPVRGAEGWAAEVAQMERRLDLAKRMGGPERVARHHAQGKLTVRERIEGLVDQGSFSEFMGLVGHAVYDGDDLAEFTPKGSVEGFCEVGGRPAVVAGGDFTVQGGAGGRGGGGNLGAEPPAARRALEWQIPYIRLLDAAGGSVRTFEEIGRTYLPDGNTNLLAEVQLLRTVPVVSAVMGSIAGLPAVQSCFAHFNVMVRGTSQLFMGGPPVVKVALGDDLTKEELGGYALHTRDSGVIDNVAESEADAFQQVRQFLSYLPSNVWSMAPRVLGGDDPNRCEERLLSVVPRDRHAAYDAHEIVNAVVDRGSFFELAPDYGRSRITGLARIDGYSVGVMANNLMFGGATDVACIEKTIRLIQLCDTFHLPMISLADEPGVMVGLDAERRGVIREAARLVFATCDSRMPWATVVVGQLYGLAGACHHRPSGMFQRFAWPSANWGSMHIGSGTAAAYRTEIASAPDPELKLREIEARLAAIASPFRTAEATGQDIIDPRTTRQRLARFVTAAQPVLHSQLGQTAREYRP